MLLRSSTASVSGRAEMGEQAWKQRDCERKKKAKAINPETVREKQRQNLLTWQVAKKAADSPTDTSAAAVCSPI